ncbi:hypothetical protein I3843_07G097000 [Carya illinoinensis]|nr:hypothetical protein I3760_07G097700 [Carya illinoinensis]KAG7970677.1 hypothetical protein I3843_07G097000 [Carya illinoinensis]
MYRRISTSFWGYQPMLSFLNIMDVRNHLVDVSSFFLFEATGDSQDNCDPAAEGDVGHVDIAMADDDAESFSYDMFDALRDNELEDCDPQAFVLHESSDDEDDDAGHEEEVEEEEAHSCQTWNSEHNWNPTGHQKSGASVDSRKDQLMTEAEKSRRFWEACLAS